MQRLKLRSFDEVVAVFGGPSALARMVNQKPASIWNWEHKRGRFPSKLYKSMTETLAEHGYTAPPELWGQIDLGAAKPLQRAA